MVTEQLYDPGDVVAERLSRSGDGSKASMLQWVQGQQERAIMRRRAAACAVSSWALLATAAVVSCFVAVLLSREAYAILSEVQSDSYFPALTANTRPSLVSMFESSPALLLVPGLLAIVTLIIVAGGAAAWWGGWFPGWSRAVSALDWSASADAVHRLLAVGCTYSEAFRLAAETVGGRSSQAWLKLAADRVEQGGQPVDEATFRRGGDAGMLEVMVATAGNDPSRRWRIASDHFLQLATRRLTLFLQGMPMIATILSGLIVWIAISSTLGWMWRAAANMIREIGY